MTIHSIIRERDYRWLSMWELTPITSNNSNRMVSLSSTQGTKTIRFKQAQRLFRRLVGKGYRIVS